MNDHGRLNISHNIKNGVLHSPNYYTNGTKHSQSNIDLANNVLQQLYYPLRDNPNEMRIERGLLEEVPPQCKCVPDLYSQVLGPTADETILAGLRAVIQLCEKLGSCSQLAVVQHVKPVKDSDNTDLPERDNVSNHIRDTDHKDQNQQEDRIDSNREASQINGSQHEDAEKPEGPSQHQKGSNTHEPSELMPKEVYDPPHKRQMRDLKIFAEFPEIVEEPVEVAYAQDVAAVPSLENVDSIELISTDNTKYLPQTPSPNSSQAQSLKFNQMTRADEHKCISPPEPPKKAANCQCCKCTHSQKDKTSCGCQVTKSITGHQDESVEGDKDSPQEVRYAVTKISKYKEFTIFEVMKPSKKLPKHMPKSIEGVFVLKNEKNKVQKETNGHANGKHNGNNNNYGSNNGRVSISSENSRHTS